MSTNKPEPTEAADDPRLETAQKLARAMYGALIDAAAQCHPTPPTVLEVAAALVLVTNTAMYGTPRLMTLVADGIAEAAKGSFSGEADHA